MSCIMRIPDFCICNSAADQHICFRYIDSSIPLLLRSNISSRYLSSVAVQPGLCRTWLETLKTGFVRRQLIME